MNNVTKFDALRGEQNSYALSRAKSPRKWNSAMCTPCRASETCYFRIVNESQVNRQTRKNWAAASPAIPSNSVIACSTSRS